ncbi:MAG: exosome complex protein Rrp42 [Candidatus Micrarchaeota archaeon]|nr:exosome complex protein Rrp42 [Candidatus Micrarchaeota archaeon]
MYINVQKRFIERLAKEQRRIDGRAFDEFRKIKIETDVVPQAEGSAMVTIGETQVMVGVKMDVGEPFPDTPDEGVLMSGAELHPMASPRFESGPPGPESIELARVVDRGIREAHAIDMKKLCIEEGEKIWMVMVDTHVINHQGNLIDATGLGAMAALLSAKMPKYEDGVVVFGEKTNKGLPVNHKVVPVTIARIGGHLMIDPSLEEEDVMDARITISTKDNGNITAMQKGLSAGLSVEEIEKAMEIAVKKGKELRKLF